MSLTSTCMQRIKVGFFLLLFLVFHPVNSQLLLDEQSYKFGKVLDLVNKHYVDTVNQEELVEFAITEMLHKLDPHSAYITRSDVEEMTEHLKGKFEGIGVTFNVLKDTIYIINPISGGPSEKVGIMAGDRIIKIEDENVAGVGIKNTDVIAKLRGEKGTKVTVYVKRRNVGKLLKFTITRDEIPIYSLDASYMINDSVGYIRLNSFGEKTMDEFFEASLELKKNHAKHLILDLSGNGGGLLDVAFMLSDQFLEADKMIVYTEGYNSPRREYKSTSSGIHEQGKLVIMIDEGSASASEIVSGAVQDWDRGLIVGRRSFGKGLVQRQITLPDFSVIRLTIARYYTPTGRLIQKPYDEGYEEYTKDLINRYNSGELSNEDSVHFLPSQKYRTLENQRLVYGGGGIFPDFFVPIDTSQNSQYYRDILGQGILNRFILEYVDKNRKSLNKKYTEFEDFKQNFEVGSDIFDKLIKYGEKEGVELVEEDLEKSRKKLALLIKAYIARDLWTNSEFFEIINQDDPIFQKAVEVITDKQKYNNRLKKD